MLKVRIGYNDFFFPEDEISEALYFARCAYVHIAKEDKDENVSIIFLNEKEDSK